MSRRTSGGPSKIAWPIAVVCAVAGFVALNWFLNWEPAPPADPTPPPVAAVPALVASPSDTATNAVARPRATASFRGTIVHPDGSLLANRTVNFDCLLRGSQRFSNLVSAVTTGADGSFALGVDREMQVHYTVRCDAGTAWGTARPHNGTFEPKTIQLLAGRRVAGRVEFQDTGALVGPMTVQMFVSSPEFGNESCRLLGEFPNGRFSFDAVPSGSIHVNAFSPDMESGAAKEPSENAFAGIDADAGYSDKDIDTLVLRTVRCRRFAGRVITPNNMPYRGASIYVAAADHSQRIRAYNRTETDEAGQFVVANLPEIPVNIEVQAPPHLPLNQIVEPHRDEATFVLGGLGGAIEGLITAEESGAPLPKARVQALPEDAPNYSDGSIVNFGNLRYSYGPTPAVSPGSNGWYKIESLASGPYQVIAGRPDGAGTMQTAQVQAGTTVRLDFRLPSRLPNHLPVRLEMEMGHLYDTATIWVRKNDQSTSHRAQLGLNLVPLKGPGVYEVRATNSKHRPASTTVTLQDEPWPEVLLRLASQPEDSYVTVRGVVRTADGHPASGAFVRAGTPDLERAGEGHVTQLAGEPWVSLSQNAPVGTDGSFTFRTLPGELWLVATAYSSSVDVETPSELCHSARSAAVRVDAPAEGLELTLGRAGSIRVTIRDDETGKPIEKAWVFLHEDSPIPDERSAVASFETHRNEGPFLFCGLDPGPFTIVADMQDDTLQVESPPPVTVTAGQEVEVTLTVRRSKFGTVVGRVLQPGGQPASGAVVTINNFNQVAVTDASGLFRATNIPTGPQWIHAHWNDYRDDAPQVEVRAGEESEMTIQLLNGGSIVGRVTQADGVTPLPNARVGCSVPWWWGANADFAEGDGAQFKQVQGLITTTDAAGRFQFDRLNPFPRQILLAQNGRIVATSETLTVKDGEQREVHLRLPAADGSVRVRVLDAANRPVEGAWVGVYQHDDHRNAKTGPDGSALFESIRPERAEAWARHTAADGKRWNVAQTVNVPPNETSEVVFEMSKAGGVRGQVLDAATGAPLPGARCGIPGAGWAVDSNGAFEALELHPGDYAMRVSCEGFMETNIPLTIVHGQVAGPLSIRLRPITDPREAGR